MTSSINYSEDYYGDLDLKSIRKSELIAGTQNTAAQGKISKRPQQGPSSAAAKEA